MRNVKIILFAIRQSFLWKKHMVVNLILPAFYRMTKVLYRQNQYAKKV